MKRTSLIVTLLLLSFSFFSCQKNKIDGIYDPKEKIDKIYVKYTYVEKHLSEDWTWKDDQLKSIDYYDMDGDIMCTDLFSYNGERLIQVDNYEYNSSMKYRYDHKNRLLEASHSYNGKLSETYDFEYDDNELSDIKLTIYDDESFEMNSRMNPLTSILPKQALTSMEKFINNNLSRANNTVEIDLEWNEDNISEIKFDLGDYSEKCIFEYDDKQNPFRGFLGVYFEELILQHGNFASENNITKITIVEEYKGVSATDTEFVTYTYDGKFPATRSYDGSTDYFEYE